MSRASSTVKIMELKMTNKAMQKMMMVLQPLSLNMKAKMGSMKMGNSSLTQRTTKALCSPKVMYCVMYKKRLESHQVGYY